MAVALAAVSGSNFFSSGLRQKVDQLMNILWAGGVNNPMDSIEQISYLLFLRLLTRDDELLATIGNKTSRIFSGKWARFAWGNFVTLTGDNLFNAAREAIESLHELPGLTETGKLLFNRATLKIYDRPTLRAVVQEIDTLDLEAHEGHDLKGDMYEYLLGKLAASGTNGQFRTPRHIIDLIVALVDPQPGKYICDPACGTAGFLISTYNYILRQHTKSADARGGYRGTALSRAQWTFLEERGFTGFDNDANMVKIAIMNLYLHQLAKANLEIMNPLTTGLGGTYLLLFLLSKAVYLANAGVGATVKGLTLADYQHLNFPVPPITEQDRIIGLLDEADALRQLRAQADRRTADLIPALFHEMFGDDQKEAGQRIRLEGVARIVSGVAKGRKFNGRQPIDVPYLRVANVQDGHLDLSEIKTIQALPAEVEELTLRKGDVLLTEGGDYDKLGRGVMLEHDMPNCIHQNHIFRVRVEHTKLEPIFFATFLLTSEAKEYFLSCAKRTTNLASINMRQLRALPVPLPRLSLQKDFAARIAEIRELEAQQAANRRHLDDLFQSLLHRAFAGEL